jgi:hypothetical protein
MRVQKLKQKPTFDAMNDKYFFVAVATAIVPPMDLIEFVHTDNDGFFLKAGPAGACLFKGEQLANKVAYELEQDNPPRKFRLIELKKS